MRAIATTAVSVVLASAAFAAEVADIGAKPTSSELLGQGFRQVASGELTMRRFFVADPAWTGFAHHDHVVAQMPGGNYRSEEIRAAMGRYADYVRLARGSEEYVCVVSDSDECYRASTENK